MIIHIKKREDPYVRIDKKAIEDNRMTWRAKGMLVYLLSKPPNWKIRMSQIVATSKEGRDAIKAAFQELREAGYAKLINAGSGKEWIISEEAQPENPQPEKPLELKTRLLNKNDCNNKNEEEAVLRFEGLPENLETEEFKEAWKSFVQYRTETRRSKLKPVSVRTQWKQMSKWGVERSIQAINDTIRNQWTGIFEPKDTKPKNGSTFTPPSEESYIPSYLR